MECSHSSLVYSPDNPLANHSMVSSRSSRSVGSPLLQHLVSLELWQAVQACLVRNLDFRLWFNNQGTYLAVFRHPQVSSLVHSSADLSPRILNSPLRTVFSVQIQPASLDKAVSQALQPQVAYLIHPVRSLKQRLFSGQSLDSLWHNQVHLPNPPELVSFQRSNKSQLDSPDCLAFQHLDNSLACSLACSQACSQVCSQACSQQQVACLARRPLHPQEQGCSVHKRPGY